MKLIPIFQHMYHDPMTCKQARELCIQLLPSYPGRGFVLVTLHTLSQLASRSLVDIPQQVVLLLDYVEKDPRRAVKIAALKDLGLLAAKGPHMWTAENIKALCNFAKKTPFDVFMLGSLHVLTTLSSSIAISSFSTQDDAPEMEMCTICCYHSNIQIAAKSTELLTHLAIHKFKASQEEGQELIEDAAMALESLLVVTTSDPSQKNITALKLVLQCVDRLCRACPSVSDRFMDMATTAVNTRADTSTALVCECLASIGSRNNDLLPSLTDDLLKALDHTVQAGTCSRDQLVVALSTVLFQSCVGEPIPEHIQAGIGCALEVTNQWTAYRVARQAARYGHHHIAARLFESQTSKVSTEHFHFWLSALRDCCLAETCLQRPVYTTADYMTNISNAETCYHKAIAAVKAATTPMSLLAFQCQYLYLRTQMLQAQAQLVRVCCSFQTSPPPAIASSLAITTGKEIHRCGHIVTQLQKCSQQFDALSKMYGNLYQSSFDADPATLDNLQILQQSCQLMIHVLESLLRSTSDSEAGPSVSPPMSGPLVEHQPWLNACGEVLKKLKETEHVVSPDVGPGDIRPPTAEHMETMQTASMLLTSVPLCFPRYFFQSLQATSIKLAISPQPRSPSDPITVHYDAHLAVKVEGVIQHGVHPGLFRKVMGVSLSVSSAQQSRAQMIAEVKVRENPTNEMKQTAEPHNDYFSTQFLLAFPIAGIHLVSIEAAVVDENGVEWRTGPKASLSVKSYDEAVQRQQQQQYAAQRQQQRAAMSVSSF